MNKLIELTPNKKIVDLMIPAYTCPHFSNISIEKTNTKKCIQANYLPEYGHIPRGFIGAIAEIKDIEAIFVQKWLGLFEQISVS